MQHPESQENLYIQRDIDRVIALMAALEAFPNLEYVIQVLREIENVVEADYEPGCDRRTDQGVRFFDGT